ncbi:hypothetical protein [Streptomyces sp. NPDC046727]|uniref:hypothetical protein n=1 Tax=Streptomyces sp. NPDC046727 TaxID=3155373 RepID=UPI003408A567
MNARKAGLAIAACLALLSGCGGGESGESVSLDAGQARAVLPDAASVPGWQNTVEPVVFSLKKEKAMGFGRCFKEGAQDSCAQVRFIGASGLYRQKKPSVDFIVQTYRDEATAKSAYGTVWKIWKQQILQPKATSAGQLGDQRSAVVGLGPSAAEGSKTLMILVRVGSVITLSMATSAPQVDMTDSFLTQFADAFAKRAEEAQAGKTPSAAIKAPTS